jgi:hypothetical protein
MTMIYTLPQSDMIFVSQIPTDREIYAIEKWFSNTRKNLKVLYPANPLTYINVTLTWRWYIRYLNLAWVVSLRLLQIWWYMPLKIWLSYNLQKLKLLYPANPSTYIDVTLPWRWYIRYLKLTWVVSLRFLQIGRYMPLKNWFRITFKN